MYVHIYGFEIFMGDPATTYLKGYIHIRTDSKRCRTTSVKHYKA